MTQAEIFDIFDKKMNKIGQDTRKNVHALGLWHQTFHCWIVYKSIDGELQLLLQLRHKDKDTYPNLLDISCAGHLLAGESVEDGIRELREELGLEVPFSDLIYCGLIAEENVISSSLIDREFNHVFVYACNKPLNEYQIQIDEISGLFLMRLDDFEDLLNGIIQSVVLEGLLFDDSNAAQSHGTLNVTVVDFTPNSPEYLNLLLNKIKSEFMG